MWGPYGSQITAATEETQRPERANVQASGMHWCPNRSGRAKSFCATPLAPVKPVRRVLSPPLPIAPKPLNLRPYFPSLAARISGVIANVCSEDSSWTSNERGRETTSLVDNS